MPSDPSADPPPASLARADPRAPAPADGRPSRPAARTEAPGPPASLAEAALAQLTEGVIVTDAAGHITFVNEAAARLHGVARLDVAPEAYAATYHLLTLDGRPYPSAELPLARAVQRGETVLDAAWRIRRPDGTEVRAVGSARPVRGPDGTPVGAVLTVRDDTARADAAAALQASLVELTGQNAQLQEQGLELELANQQLQDQAAELEIQAEALQATTDALAERTAAAEAAEGQLHAAFAQAPAAVAVTVGAEHRFAVANAGFARLVGRAVRAGQTFRAALPEIAAQGYTALLDQVYMTGTPYAAHESHAWVDKGGVAPEEGWYNFVYQPLVDAAGRVTGIMQLGIEVTDQVRARRGVEALNAELRAANVALAAGEARFRAVQEASPNGFTLIRPVRGGGPQDGRPDGAVVDFTIVDINAANARLVGSTPEQMRGRRMRDFFPGAWEAGLFAAYVRVLETGAPHQQDVRYRHDGIDGGFAVTVVRVGDEVAVTYADVTDRVRAEAERARLLAESEVARAAADLERRRLATVLEQLPVGVTLAEAPSGQLLLSNAAVRRIWGLDTPSARVDAYSADYVGYHTGPGADAGRPYASHEWPLARALTRGETVTDEVVEIQHPDDTRRRVSISAAPVRDAAARVVGGVVTSVDVTERERLLAESVAARARAEVANATKAQFLANMSHELRTPLNAIGGYVQLLELGLYGPVTDVQRGTLGRVQAAQRHLLSLINDVLNYAKLEGGRVEYDVRPVDVRDVVADVLPLVEPQLAAKGLALAVRLPEGSGTDAPCVVWADREKLGQVLVNLLSNAVKFTEARHPATGAPGRVTVHVAERGGRADLLFLRVSDTGRGVPREKQDAIFDPFVQVQTGYASATEGTGLGLAISRDLARGMGGDLRVRSAPGEGATFTVALRRAAGRG